MDAYLTQAERDLTFTDNYTLRFPDLSRLPEGAHPAVAVPMEVLGDDGRPVKSLTVLGLPRTTPTSPST